MLLAGDQVYSVKTTQTTGAESGRVAPGHERWLLEQAAGRRPAGRPIGWIKGRRTWSEGNQGGQHLWNSPTPKTRTRRSWPVAPHSQRRLLIEFCIILSIIVC